MRQFLYLIAILFCFASCSSDNDNAPIENGTWRVTLFTDSGNDETGDFAGYSFQFKTDGKLMATKAGAVKEGTWSRSASSNKFLIDLGPKDNTNKPLGELTDDWKIISIGDNQVRLTDDNASSQEFLTFTRN
jgi:hypothetical protein